jgi:CheY-like chemotaxis protein
MATILVIDDEHAMRFTIAACLGQLGHTVVEAEHGREGLERHAVSSAKFDLVICDLILPSLGGIATIRTLQDRAADLPILVISGATKTLAYLASHEPSTARAYLTKPFTQIDLVEAVERLLQASAATVK